MLSLSVSTLMMMGSFVSCIKLYDPLCRKLQASVKKSIEHLRSILGHPGGVHLLPQENEGIGDADADQRGAKADAQQLGAIPDDSTRTLQGCKGLVARGHALECILRAIGEEARQACLDRSSPWPAKGEEDVTRRLTSVEALQGL